MENPINTKDPIIEQITIQLESMKYSWNFAGLINFNNTIYPFGNDSKIIGRIFEIAAREALSMAAQKLGYIFQENPTQTVYPDFYFAIPNTDKLIAIDIKTTYRQSSSASFKFTAGALLAILETELKISLDIMTIILNIISLDLSMIEKKVQLLNVLIMKIEILLFPLIKM